MNHSHLKKLQLKHVFSYRHRSSFPLNYRRSLAEAAVLSVARLWEYNLQISCSIHPEFVTGDYHDTHVSRAMTNIPSLDFDHSITLMLDWTVSLPMDNPRQSFQNTLKCFNFVYFTLNNHIFLTMIVSVSQHRWKEVNLNEALIKGFKWMNEWMIEWRN